MVMVGTIEKACRSCGQGFVLNLCFEAEEVSCCRSCRSLRGQVEQELNSFRARSAAAKKLLIAVVAAQSSNKFVLAWDLTEQFVNQVLSDRVEADNRSQRDKAKKARWYAKQPERRHRDHAQTMARRGK